jgi:murein DD-endopeptidase MepM/ murein hydrolase activator NlpD
MERYSLIVVADETSPIRRFDVRKTLVQRAVFCVAAAACVLLIGLADYVRVRVDHRALAPLRAANAEQREQIESFRAVLSEVESDLARLQNLERKVRIIANLPGSVATGGEGVTEVAASGEGDLDAAARGSAAVAVSDDDTEDDGGEEPPGDAAHPPAPGDARSGDPGATPLADRVSVLRRDAERLGQVAEARERSLDDLLDQLEGKRHRLASTPAIWPTQGWLTSRFGNRISPFTGSRQFHAGIDIAGATGTDVIAPARGKISYAGSRGPLGRSLTIDHGYGVRTLYGHVDDIFVERGQEIERAQVIASLGSSGRSTGPHLHYVVEVKGKAVNPLDYIFD